MIHFKILIETINYFEILTDTSFFFHSEKEGEYTYINKK